MFRFFDQNIAEKALGNYAAYKQLRILYLHACVGWKAALEYFSTIVCLRFPSIYMPTPPA